MTVYSCKLQAVVVCCRACKPCLHKAAEGVADRRSALHAAPDAPLAGFEGALAARLADMLCDRATATPAVSLFR